MVLKPPSGVLTLIGLVALLGGCGGASEAADAGTTAPPAPETYVESTLDLALSLSIADGGSGAVSILKVTALDGATPVITDLWLYALDADQALHPISGFSSTAKRKSPRLMLPATLDGEPSGLAPADDGNENGVMTNALRGVVSEGSFVNTVDGTVRVTLPAAPTAPILVIAGVEDQRYAGAAAINPDGTPGTVPAGVGAPETHTRRSFEREVWPILQANCALCHRPFGPANAELMKVTGSREDLVNDNFAVAEQTLDCQASHPDFGAEFDACVRAITKAEFLVEPGAPALSGLLHRSRPDEGGGISDLGMAWYGKNGSRYSPDYGDRRMPAVTQSTSPSDWKNEPTYFDAHPADFQVLYDWVAQGAVP